MAPIHISELSKVYRGKKGRRVQALTGLNLEVQQGEVFGFLGPNGAGKSTTIKALVGLIRPSSGESFVFGVPSVDPASRKRVGYLPENPMFYDFLTGREYLRFVGKAYDMSAQAVFDRTKQVLTLLDLSVAADRPIRSYSKGMVQRLGLAQTLLHDPDLFILDEPMSGLDPVGRALVKEIILDLKKQGKTVFFSTHVTSDAERVCDRIGVIVKGVLQEERVVKDLLREGVEGYFCRVRGGTSAFFDKFRPGNCFNGVFEIYVPRGDFDSFSAELIRQGGTFDLIEPRRRDVEDYFLSLVHKHEGESCV